MVENIRSKSKSPTRSLSKQDMTTNNVIHQTEISDVSHYNANGIMKPQALIDIEREEKNRKRRCTVEAPI